MSYNTEHIRKMYPPGTRIELIHMNDPYHPIASGTKGTVDYVDDAAQIHMKWDDGRSLALIPDEDAFKKIDESEKTETTETNEETDDSEALNHSLGM